MKARTTDSYRIKKQAPGYYLVLDLDNGGICAGHATLKATALRIAREDRDEKNAAKTAPTTPWCALCGLHHATNDGQPGYSCNAE